MTDHMHGPDPKTGEFCDKRGNSCFDVGRMCMTAHPESTADHRLTCGRIIGHEPPHRGWGFNMRLIDWGV